MAWFKVDDSLAFHSKVIAAGNAAMGLWARAGAWSAQQLEDGRVPGHVAAVLGTAEEAGRLVEVGLWLQEGDGFVFHEWEERQPSRAEVLARREAEAEKKRAARAAAAERRRGSSQGSSQQVSLGVSRGDSQGDAVRESGGESALPDPTRPDPTRPTPPTEGRARGARIPEPFVVTRAMREWAAEEVPGLDVDASSRRFVDYWRGVSGAKGVKKDWTATWRNWMRSDFERRPGARVSSAALAAQQALAVEAMEQRGQIGA